MRILVPFLVQGPRLYLSPLNALNQDYRTCLFNSDPFPLKCAEKHHQGLIILYSRPKKFPLRRDFLYLYMSGLAHGLQQQYSFPGFFYIMYAQQLNSFLKSNRVQYRGTIQCLISGCTKRFINS